MLLDGEARLDRLLTRPILAVGLALDEDLRSCLGRLGLGRDVKGRTHSLLVHIAVPPQAYGFRAFCLLKTSKIELQVLIVEVYRGDC